MNIGIVTNFATGKLAGLERFLVEFLKGLDRSLGGHECTVYSKKGKGLTKFIDSDCRGEMTAVEVPFGKFWKELGLLFSPKADLYLFNGTIVPLFFAPKNYYVLVYDFAYKYRKNNTLRDFLKKIYLDFITRIAFRRAKRIVAISSATKEDIIKYFDVSPDKIDVIYAGFTPVVPSEETQLKMPFEKYFFFVGTIKERKNIFNIIRAYAALSETERGSRGLVIAGKYDTSDQYYIEMQNFVKEHNLKKSVVFVGYLEDVDVRYLYTHADVLVYPSILEGFGLPILEAMSCGLPVITSNISSLVEVAGEAALLVDPTSVKEISVAMSSLVSDEHLRKKFVERGYAQAELFSWDKMAEKYVQLFEKNIS
ncbi:MAG: glycosyltransferase family 1 protein [Candidatus Magasanikbacteria bacterium]